jgi:hypothetical protein
MHHMGNSGGGLSKFLVIATCNCTRLATLSYRPEKLESSKSRSPFTQEDGYPGTIALWDLTACRGRRRGRGVNGQQDLDRQKGEPVLPTLCRRRGKPKLALDHVGTGAKLTP